MPRYLELMGAALDATPEAGFAYCDAWGLSDRDSRLLSRTELESRPGPPPGADHLTQLLALTRTNFVMSSTTVRRDALEQAGGFDTSVRGTDDYDMWFRIMLSGRTAVLGSPTPLLLQRDRFDSQSKDELMMDRGLLLVLERVIADARTPEPVRAAAAERAKGVAREIERRGGENPLPRALLGLREGAIRVRDRLFDDRRWLAQPPAEVADAFPEIARNYGRVA
jgi:hypothetical protein